MNPETFFELLFMSDFRAGVAFGAVGVLVLLAARRRDHPLPVWGIVATAAVIAAGGGLTVRHPGVIAGLGLLALGGMIMDRIPVGGWVMVVAGSVAVAVASGLVYDDLWIKVATAPFIVAAGWLVSRIDDLHGESGIPALMVGGMAFGVWATIPEPNLGRVILGVTATVMLAAWPLRRARIGTAGAYALVGLLAVAIAVGGEDRFGSVVGGWATIGAFSVAILGTHAGRIRPWWLLALHAGSVLVVSRVAGLQDSPYVAAAIAGPALIVTIVFGRYLAARERERTGVMRPASGAGER